jgi:hypothetical protein
MNCLPYDENGNWVSSVNFTFPLRNGRHRTTQAENRRTGEMLGSYDYEHKEGWTSDGANFTGPGAEFAWVAAVNKLAKGGK